MPVFDPGVPWLRGTATLTNGSTTVETDGVITLNEILEGDRLYVFDGGERIGPFEIVGGEDDEIELREAFEGATGSYSIAIDRNPITRTGAKTLRDVADILGRIGNFGELSERDQISSDLIPIGPERDAIKDALDVTKRASNLSDLANLKEARSNLGTFSSVAEVQSRHIPAVLESIRMEGYYIPGDGGGALYKRVESEPAHAGKIQSADGSWWEIAEIVANVRMFGAVGDCTDVGEGTDDSAAFQRGFSWMALAPYRKILVPSGRFRIGGAVVADLGGQVGNQVECLGWVTPDAGLHRAISIINSTGLRFVGQVNGGGSLADYSQVEPAGGTTAFYFRGNRTPKIDIVARSYQGRVARIALQEPGEQKSSMATIRIDTGDIGTGIGHIRCGQSLYAESSGASGGEYGAFGSFSGYTFWDHYGPVFEDLNDVHIGVIEGSYRETGVSFRGVQQIYADTIYVGDTPLSGQPPANQVEFVPSSNRRCSRINWGQIICLNGTTGLRLKDLDASVPNGGGKVIGRGLGTVLHTSGCRRMDIEVQSYDCGSAWVDSGDQSDLLTVRVLGRVFSQAAVDIEGFANRVFTLSGNISEKIAGGALVRLGSSGTYLRMEDLTINGGQASRLLDLPPNNQASWVGGRATKSASAEVFNNRPRMLKDVSGAPITKRKGTATISSGEASVTIDHGLVATPDPPRLVGRHAEVAAAYISSVNDTQFTISVPEPVSANRSVFWEASAEGDVGA